VSGQHQAPTALLPEKDPWYPLDRRLGGPIIIKTITNWLIWKMILKFHLCTSASEGACVVLDCSNTGILGSNPVKGSYICTPVQIEALQGVDSPS